MRVKSLADVKRNMKEQRPFYIHNHRIEKCIGQIRVAHVNQTNGVYLWEYNNPSSEVTLSNNCKGSWLEYGKASDWEIDSLTGHCCLYHGEHTDENLVMEISFFDDESVKELIEKYNTTK